MTYPVVTICGSMRYYSQMREVAEFYTASGHIVLMPFVTKNASVDATMLDDMHRRKIDMSEGIIVVGSHRGESTMGEIKYARETGKNVIESLGATRISGGIVRVWESTAYPIPTCITGHAG